MSDQNYSEGDWIVHCTYGVGQIKTVEEKPIHGENVRVFRVKTQNSIYWLPVKKADNTRIRRITNKEKLAEALAQLGTEPEEMGSDYRARNDHIKEAFANGSIEKSVELLRDLMGLREIKAWSNTENDAANTIFHQLASEYSVIYEIPIEQAREEINAVICEKFENFSML
jgi:RNA polymerase-interacting CarD/CdnL/TRCF family regulator